MKKIYLTLGISLTCLAATPAQATLLKSARQYIAGEAVAQNCAAELASQNVTISDAQLTTSLAALKASLAQQASRLHSDMSTADIDAAIDMFLDGARAKFAAQLPADDLCPAQLIQQAGPLLKFLGSDNFKRTLEANQPSWPYDSLQDFGVSSTGAQTYAFPPSRYLMLGDVVQSVYWPIGCEWVEVIAAEVLNREVRTQDDLPIFVAPTMAYSEKWTVNCRDITKVLTIDYKQNSEGGVGNYNISVADE